MNGLINYSTPDNAASFRTTKKYTAKPLRQGGNLNEYYKVKEAIRKGYTVSESQSIKGWKRQHYEISKKISRGLEGGDGWGLKSREDF